MADRRDKPPSGELRMPLTAHLAELRTRLIWSFAAIGVGFALCYAVSQYLVEFLTRPLVRVLPPGSSLVFTNLAEAFFAYLKIAFIGGVCLATPMVAYQLWKFIEPGLYEHEKRYVVPFVLTATVFFAGGVLFAYFVAFPVGFRFFMSYASETIRPLPSLKEYLSFAMKLLLAFGLVFEFPVVAVFLAGLGIVNARMLRTSRRYAILLIFIVAALFTPPDVVSQLLMAVPLYILYELSILLVALLEKGRALKRSPGDLVRES